MNELSELFALSDKIGDTYLSPEEIEKRNAELATLKAEIEALSQSN